LAQTRGLIYFIFEDGENRTTSGSGPRVVRVGSHALTESSKTTLWNRLRQHRGNRNNGGGNHRGSIFRLHVGTAIIASGWKGTGLDTWGIGKTADPRTRDLEHDLECKVSEIIGSMKVLWLPVEDHHMRNFIEKNSIALLSNYPYCSQPIDPSSQIWLGRQCANQSIACSGLWNVNHTEEYYVPDFLGVLQKLITDIKDQKIQSLAQKQQAPQAIRICRGDGRIEFPEVLYKHEVIGETLKKLSDLPSSADAQSSNLRQKLRNMGFRLSDKSTWAKFEVEARNTEASEKNKKERMKEKAFDD